MLTERLPTDLIFFATSRCHLSCKHCFNWGSQKRNNDLSLEEITNLAISLPKLKTLAISGGEPFLRKDLVEICQIFADHCRIAFVDIPTSGTLVETTIASVERILNIEPSFDVAIGVSIDGMEKYHDTNRGVPGTFAKAIECCNKLLELKKKYSRLSVNVLTTLVNDNKAELLSLLEYIANNLPGVDDVSCVIARGDVKEERLSIVSHDDVVCIDRAFQKFNLPKKNKRQQAFTNKLAEMRVEALLDNVQPVPCAAGKRIAVVYDDGAVAPCEMLPPVGNLRDAPFEVIWNSDQMRKEREKIASGQCSCTHECFLAPSLEEYLLSKPIELIKLEKFYGLYHLLYRWCGSGELGFAARKLARGVRRGRRENQ